MTVIKNRILLLKSPSSTGSDNYEALFKSHNYEVIIVNTLEFKFHESKQLKDELSRSDNFSGLLLSSPRCVEAVHLAINKNTLDSWRDKCNYVVGEATYLSTLQKLGIECRGKESGNAQNLAKLVIEENLGSEKPFLFPHGNLKTDTLKIELEKFNIIIKGVLVYDTVPNPNIEKNIMKATKNFEEFPEFIVFFSPSGLRSSLEFLRRDPDGLKYIKLIAIGPVTEMAMKEENLKIEGVAASPNPDEVLKVISQ